MMMVDGGKGGNVVDVVVVVVVVEVSNAHVRKTIRTVDCVFSYIITDRRR